MLLCTLPALAHNVSSTDLARLDGQGGAQYALFVYLGAKHMVTGYDHVLFLLGVMFLLTRASSVLLYASLFAVGHTVTLLAGVRFAWQVDANLVDALIGLSVAYKGFDNLGGWRRWPGWVPDGRLMVLGFGLIHGLGLATRLQDFPLAEEHLVGHLLAFSIGVEIGQILALACIVLALGWASYLGWRTRLTRPVNIMLVAVGMGLCVAQLVVFLW